MTEQEIKDLKLIIELLEYMMMAQVIKMQPETHEAYMRLAKSVHHWAGLSNAKATGGAE
tara:strand:- start:2670 stop:2846 length:177 start_codon:yes stop_codon:yes gene_type:complete